MTHMIHHGGACCGMHHIVGMTALEQDGLDRLENNIRLSISREGKGRLFEVVLNARQMENGRVLDVLRRYGFVLTSSFHNRTGSRCAIFHRADTRVALREWTQWQGMVINNTLEGDLPRVTHPDVPTVAGFLISTRSLCLLNQEQQEPPVLYPEHNNVGVPIPPVERLPEPVATLYHNVFQNGRSDAGWPTYQAAREAAPRAQSIEAQVIFSDGSRHWTAAVPEMHVKA